MRTNLKIFAFTAIAFGLVLNLQHAMKGYQNDGIAYAAESGSGSAPAKYLEEHGDCTITISGAAGSPYNFHGNSGTFGNSGTVTFTLVGFLVGCSSGGDSDDCHPITCSDVMDSYN